MRNIFQFKEVVRIIEKQEFVFSRSNGSHYIFTHLRTHKSIAIPYRKEISIRIVKQLVREYGIII